MNTSDLPVYEYHPGTVKVSGSTIPKRAGRCAYYYLLKGHNVEFFCIGANANQQTTKSMGVFSSLVETDPSFAGKTVAFKPTRYRTSTEDPATHEVKDKDAIVWKTFLVTLSKV